jgi:hypothetical protein
MRIKNLNHKLHNQPSAEIQNDYSFYKAENLMRCLVCQQYRANFVNLTFKDDLVYFWLNCIECGENSYWFVKFSKLKEVFIRWFYDPSVNPESFEMAWWRIFRLGHYYKSCFKNKDDLLRFHQLWHELENALHKFKNRMAKK